MYGQYWSQSSSYGYNPYGSLPPGSRMYQVPIVVRDCNNPNVPMRGGSLEVGNFETGTEYKQSIADLRNYITNLEANRSIADVNDVEFFRTPEPGDALVFNAEMGYWELTDFISGGEW